MLYTAAWGLFLGMLSVLYLGRGGCFLRHYVSQMQQNGINLTDDVLCLNRVGLNNLGKEFCLSELPNAYSAMICIPHD